MAAACHLVVFPYPLPGHFIPISTFAHTLASCGHPNIRVTIVHTEANLERLQQQGKAKTPSNLHIVGVSDGLPLHFDRTVNYQTFFFTIQQMGPALQLLLQELHTACPISCVVTDPNFPWVLNVTNNLHLPLFLFVTDSAAVFSVSLHARRLLGDGFIGKGSPEHTSALVDFIPGIPALPVKDLPFPRPEFSEFFFQLRVAMFDRVGETAGLLLNTFYELEREAVDGARGYLSLPVLPVGPCVPEFMLRDEDESEGGAADEVLRWLDAHSPASVMYVCFGSLVELSEEQILEVWEGLRASGQPFMWVTRSALAKELWRGEAAAQEEGMVVEWALQQQVLRHRAVGGFMTHCGWNSVLEGVSAGMPMLCCPIFLDQPLTCRFIVHVWRVGVDAGERVERGCLEKLIRLILIEDEGKILKQRVLELRNAARTSVQCSPPGSSIQSLHTFIQLLQEDKGSHFKS